MSLAYFATEITNEIPSGEIRKRSGADADGTSNKKRKKNRAKNPLQVDFDLL